MVVLVLSSMGMIETGMIDEIDIPQDTQPVEDIDPSYLEQDYRSTGNMSVECVRCSSPTFQRHKITASERQVVAYSPIDTPLVQPGTDLQSLTVQVDGEIVDHEERSFVGQGWILFEIEGNSTVEIIEGETGPIGTMTTIFDSFRESPISLLLLVLVVAVSLLLAVQYVIRSE